MSNISTVDVDKAAFALVLIAKSVLSKISSDDLGFKSAQDLINLLKSSKYPFSTDPRFNVDLDDLKLGISFLGNTWDASMFDSYRIKYSGRDYQGVSDHFESGNRFGLSNRRRGRRVQFSLSEIGKTKAWSAVRRLLLLTVIR